MAAVRELVGIGMLGTGFIGQFHHQGLRHEPASLRVVARAPDGLAECFVSDDAWVLAVQWHPEWMQARASQRRLFETFIAAARRPAPPSSSTRFRSPLK